MKTIRRSFLLVAGMWLLAAAAARAQEALQVGPTFGGTLGGVHFTTPPDRTQLPLRGGWLAGATATYQARSHWGAQTAMLYARQGYSQHYEGSNSYATHDQVRLNYLRVPLLATFSQQVGGQGLQAFVGPYLGVLLGGTRTYTVDNASGGYFTTQRVLVADMRTEPAYTTAYAASYLVADYTGYSRRFDVGLQGGLGYRLGNALLQAGYTLGLRNLATTSLYEAGNTSYRVAGAPYRTRGWQVVLTYLLGARP